MAKCSCRVKISGFKPNLKGYAAVMNGSSCQGILKDHAERTKEAADGMVSDDGYTSAESHKIGTAHGKLSNGYYVRTYTHHAKYSNAAHNNLKKALR